MTRLWRILLSPPPITTSRSRRSENAHAIEVASDDAKSLTENAPEIDRFLNESAFETVKLSNENAYETAVFLLESGCEVVQKDSSGDICKGPESECL